MEERILLRLFLIFLIIGVALLTHSEAQTEIELKPLEIKGPTFAEVNETVSFSVTSKGLPVKGAIVFFAGYEKETNESGIATFKIDFAGPFKAVTSKEGYKTNSTLLWVFPKGNEKFNIRSTKSVADPQQSGNTISAFRMAGFNYARVKAYYTYDEQGNVYPVITGGDIPWTRVSDDVHFKSLEWVISRARDWGFKIYLHAQLFYVDPETGEMMDLWFGHLLEGAEKNFLEQRRRHALKLAAFAEEQRVELLDPLSFSTLLPREEFLLYKDCLLYTSPSPRDLSTSRMPSSA